MVEDDKYKYPMPETDRLKKRLFEMGSVKNFKFDSPLETQTAEGREELMEEIAREINKALDEIEANHR